MQISDALYMAYHTAVKQGQYVGHYTWGIKCRPLFFHDNHTFIFILILFSVDSKILETPRLEQDPDEESLWLGPQAKIVQGQWHGLVIGPSVLKIFNEILLNFRYC